MNLYLLMALTFGTLIAVTSIAAEMDEAAPPEEGVVYLQNCFERSCENQALFPNENVGNQTFTADIQE